MKQKVFKKLAASIVAVAMALSMLAVVPAKTVNASETNAQLMAYTTITVDSTKTATISTAGGYAYFSFTPSTSGTYYFYSEGDYDTYGYLYNSTCSSYYTSDDDGGDDCNFCMTYSCTAGTTYIIAACMYDSDDTGSFTVGVSSNPVVIYGTTLTKVATMGNSVTLTAAAYDGSGNDIDLTESGYTFKWYKYTTTKITSDGESYYVWNQGETVLGTGRTYTISSVKTSDCAVYEEEELSAGEAYYVCDIYYNGTKKVTSEYYIYDMALYASGLYTYYYRNSGDSCTLYALATDYYDDIIDFSSGYTFKWYKYTYNTSSYEYEKGTSVLSTSRSYAISSLGSSDFYSNSALSINSYGSGSVYYACEIYKSGTLIATSVSRVYAGTATNASSFDIAIKDTSITYNGSAQTPTVYVMSSSGYKLSEGYDYVLTYSNNINAGTATATVTGIGSYTGTKSVTFTIAKASQTVAAVATASSIKLGGTCQVKGVGSEGGSISYKSSNTSIATVSSSGKVTAKGIGTATITVTAAATTNYKAASTTVKITVKVAKGDTYKASGYKVKITKVATNGKGTVQILGSTKKASKLKKATIPATIKVGGVKFKVTSIAKNAFSGYTKLKTVTIGKYVKTIGANAFYGCTSLSKITIKGKKLKSVGEGAISGIVSTATIKAPKKKLKAYTKLFKSKTGFVSTMTIKK